MATHPTNSAGWTLAAFCRPGANDDLAGMSRRPRSGTFGRWLGVWRLRRCLEVRVTGSFPMASASRNDFSSCRDFG